MLTACTIQGSTGMNKITPRASTIAVFTSVSEVCEVSGHLNKAHVNAHVYKIALPTARFFFVHIGGVKFNCKVNTYFSDGKILASHFSIAI